MSIFETLYQNESVTTFGGLVQKIDSQYKKISSKINISNWDVSEDGTTDDYSKINTALVYCRSNNVTLVFNTKTYRVETSLNIADVNIEWNGAKFSSPNIKLFTIKGTAGTVYNTTSDTYKKTNFIPITNSTFLDSISSGDLIKVINDTETQSTTEDTVNYQAEIHKVQSKSSAGLFISEGLHADYLTANGSRIHKINKVGAKWVGEPTIIFDIPTVDTTNGVGIEIEYAENVEIDINVANSRVSVIFDSVFNCSANAKCFNGFENLSGSNILGYGVTYASSNHLKIWGNYIGFKHATTAGASSSGSGVNYDVQIVGVNGVGFLDNPVFDTHDISGDVTYLACKAVHFANQLGGLEIINYDSGTTYNIDANQIIRGSNGEFYQAKANGIIGIDPTTSNTTNWKLWHSNGVGWVVEGYTSTLIDCEAINCDVAIQATSETPQGILIRNFKATNCSYGLLLQNVKVGVVDVDGFELINDYRSSRQNYAIAISCDIDYWYFNNIRTRNSGLISLNQATMPSNLKLNNITCYNDIQEVTLELIENNNLNTTIELSNYEFTNVNYNP